LGSKTMWLNEFDQADEFDALLQRSLRKGGESARAGFTQRVMRRIEAAEARQILAEERRRERLGWLAYLGATAAVAAVLAWRPTVLNEAGAKVVAVVQAVEGSLPRLGDMGMGWMVAGALAAAAGVYILADWLATEQ
jgi:hypothetical protein